MTKNNSLLLGATAISLLLSQNVRAESDSAWGSSPAVKKEEQEKPQKKKKKKSKKKEENVASDESKINEANTEVKNVTAEKSNASASSIKEVIENSREPASAPNEEKNEVELNLKTAQGCFVVNFKNAPGTLPACSELLPVTYTKRNCIEGKVEETGESQAAIDCSDKKRLSLKFRTSDLVVSTTMLITRENEGRKGATTRFVVQGENAEEQSSFKKILPEAIIKPTVEAKPEEAPLKFKASGFTSIEYESLRGFGFAKINQLPNISGVAIADQSTASDFNLLSNISFDISRDQTTLSTVLEVGEIYFGDSGTSGARSVPGTDQQDRKGIIEIRNFYLTHEFNNRLNVQGGILAISSDPRAFVYSDNAAGFKLNYKADLYDGFVYFAQGFKNSPTISSRPVTGMEKNEWTGGFSASGAFFGGLKSTLFGTFDHSDNLSVTDSAGSETAQTSSYWLGTTLDMGSQDAVSGQLSLIGNWNQTLAPSDKEIYSSYLLDGKLGFMWEAPRINFSLEGLLTPGSTDGALGHRRAFASQTGTHYLFNVVGSDGWDDAPGSAREYVVGPTNLQEGMRVIALTATSSINKNFTSYLRGGYIATAAEQSVTQSKHFGTEYDAGATYQITPSTSWQFDFGAFLPGKYFAENLAPVYLGATKIRFNF